MSVLQKATKTLSEIESELLAANGAASLDPARLAEQVHQVRELLSGEDAEWVGEEEARRILGFTMENAIKAWARLELLRSRIQDGRLEVRLDDVLYRRMENEALRAIGGEDLTEEELKIMREERPGKNPWEREKAEQRE
ncbi:MAG: hypothetical protein H0V51_19605 [Chloroflexi bacterium]|nr:hypothetical protein [Chloroflexota bacterium]